MDVEIAENINYEFISEEIINNEHIEKNEKKSVNENIRQLEKAYNKYLIFNRKVKKQIY